jgi:hypothetical protein
VAQFIALQKPFVAFVNVPLTVNGQFRKRTAVINVAKGKAVGRHGSSFL